MTDTDSHLFISPHLDDAVLSCGGTIHQLVQRGDSVTVLTVMAGDPPDPPPDTPIVRDLHQRWQAGYSPVEARRQEDIAALKLLGANFHHLDIPDCVNRVADGVALYPDEDSLWTHVQPDDPAKTALQSLDLPPDATLYFPLGVGEHVDHLLLRDWALSLDPQLARMAYAEYPYSQQPGSVAAALAQAGSHRLQAQTRVLSEANVQAKIDAVACYASQISTFWADLDAMAAEVRRALAEAGHGTAMEEFWRVG
jgi:LmbE family N-acetylglucosaminyl deacetylase